MDLDDTASLPTGCSKAEADFFVKVESFPTVAQHAPLGAAGIRGRSPE
jgi:hypothetical protein